MKKIVRKFIDLPVPLKKQIANEYPKCTDDTVRNALNYKTTGENADRIRRRAIELGGIESTKNVWVHI